MAGPFGAAVASVPCAVAVREEAAVMIASAAANRFNILVGVRILSPRHQSLDRAQPFRADIEAEAVDVECDVLRTHLS